MLTIFYKNSKSLMNMQEELRKNCLTDYKKFQSPGFTFCFSPK